MEQNKFYQIKNITEHEYTLVGCDGSVITRPIQDVDRLASAFTIKDAKDGDVLASGGVIFIFNKIHGEWVKCHFSLYKDKSFIINSDLMTLKYGKEIYPATKEQRDLLFQKMKETGYVWDADKKELKKIEQKPAWPEKEELAQAKKDAYNRVRELKESTGVLKQLLVGQKSNCSEEALQYLRENHSPSKVSDFQAAMNIAVANAYDKGKADAINTMKTEWSEEDERMLTLSALSVKTRYNDGLLSSNEYEQASLWLKSLKDRVRPQNITVTDEELAQAKKDAYNDALDKIEYHSGEPTFDDGWGAAIWYLKKRNAQPQNTWKPRDEQMDALETAISSLQSTALESLYNELKKL